MQENTVEIITRFFGRNRKARLVDNLDQRACGNFERGGQFALCDRWEIFTRQRCEREARTASVHRHAAICGMQLDLRTFGQFARDFEQGVRRNCGCTGGFDIGGKCFNDLQIKVRRGQLDLAAFAGFDQDVRQNGNSVAPFHNGLDVAQAFQQGRAFDRGSHSNSPYRAWRA